MTDKMEQYRINIPLRHKELVDWKVYCTRHEYATTYALASLIREALAEDKELADARR